MMLPLPPRCTFFPYTTLFRSLIINGVSAIGFNLGSDFSLRLGAGALPLSGTYTVVVTPGNGTPGSIQFTLWKDVSGSGSEERASKLKSRVHREHPLLLTIRGA